ncbi:7-cyano-7-deazaguanine synthase [subsurface metagenome]|jgi:7-cyano-7-deazaguanine synthase
MKSAVVLLSGGIDSSVLLYYLATSTIKYECYPLTILYGQKHSKEVIAARSIAESLNLEGKFINLTCLKELLPSSLTGIGDIPQGCYTDKSMKSTAVPNRNMILLAIAAGYAQGLGAGIVAYAAHAGDHTLYPDCRPEWIKSARKTIELGTGWDNDEVKLLAPFSIFSKADIVELGIKLKVPFELTWSCYEGKKEACGECGTCIERLAAFAANSVIDPIQYKGRKNV